LITFWRSWEGDQVILGMEVQVGRLSGFCRWHHSYRESRQRVRELLAKVADRAGG
jgi:hypothetical protein